MNYSIPRERTAPAALTRSDPDVFSLLVLWAPLVAAAHLWWNPRLGAAGATRSQGGRQIDLLKELTSCSGGLAPHEAIISSSLLRFGASKYTHQLLEPNFYSSPPTTFDSLRPPSLTTTGLSSAQTLDPNFPPFSRPTLFFDARLHYSCPDRC